MLLSSLMLGDKINQKGKSSVQEQVTLLGSLWPPREFN